MKVIDNPSLNPFFNLALEEYILTQYPDDDFFILWRNSKTVVVGKYQNAFAEINREYVDKHGVCVVRRMTGGGAVFHDLGNLNFTFIQSGGGRNGFDFVKYSQPIINVLNELGVEARFEGRNDLTIEGMKFVGNAALVWNEQIMHHGCILFSAELSDLAQSLNVNPLKFKDKAVKSVRKRVTNIVEHLDKKIDVVEFKDLLIAYMLKNNAENFLYDLTAEDRQAIEQLARDKYSQWEWNYGKSPKHEMKIGFRTEAGGNIEVNINVSEGVISDIKIYGDFFSQWGVAELESLITGTRFDTNDLYTVMQNIEFNKYITNVTVKEFIESIMTGNNVETSVS